METITFLKRSSYWGRVWEKLSGSEKFTKLLRKGKGIQKQVTFLHAHVL